MRQENVLSQNQALDERRALDRLDMAGFRFAQTIECPNCGARDQFHDATACRQADYISFMIWLGVEPVGDLDTQEGEEEEPQEWDGFDDSDEPYFARLEREALQRAMYA